MKATIVNTSLDSAATAPGYVTIPPNSTKVLTGLSKAQCAQLQAKATRQLMVTCEPDPSDADFAVATMSSPADPAGGTLTLAGNGFTLKDSAGTTLSVAEKVGLALFADAACTVPHPTAKIASAQTGTIQKGAGTNAVEATTAAGVLACTVTVTGPTTVYARGFGLAAGTRILSCPVADAVTYS